MMKFYELQKMQSVTANLSWGHWIELLSIKNINEMKYYINQAEKLFLTTRELRQRIKNNEYERLDESTKEELKEKIKKQRRIKSTRFSKKSYSNKEYKW